MVKGMTVTQIKKLKEFLEYLGDCLPNFEYDADKFNVKNFFSQLDFYKKVCKTALTPLPDEDKYSSYAEKTKAEYEFKNLPDNYYKLKIGTTCVKIVLTSRCYDFNLCKWYHNSHKKMYSVKVYGFFPKISKDKVLPYDVQNQCYGCFETLDEAIHLFFLLSQDCLETNGFNVAKNMELFYSLQKI